MRSIADSIIAYKTGVIPDAHLERQPMDIKAPPIYKRAKVRRFLRDGKVGQAQIAGDIKWMTAAFAQCDKKTIVRWAMTRYL
jgi:hypothetical protein